MFGKIKDAVTDWRTTLGGILVAVAILGQEWLSTGSTPEQGWWGALLSVVLGVVAGDRRAPKALPVK